MVAAIGQLTRKVPPLFKVRRGNEQRANELYCVVGSLLSPSLDRVIIQDATKFGIIQFQGLLILLGAKVFLVCVYFLFNQLCLFTL